MDKFVTRRPTWQKLTYATALERSRKDVQPKSGIVKRKPLRESQLQPNAAEISSPSRSKRRLSIRDEHLLMIFASKPDQPLLPSNEDSGLSSSSQGSLDNFNYSVHGIPEENQSLPAKTKNLCELSDYVSCTDATRSQQKLLNSQSPPVTFKEVLFESTQTNNIAGITSKTAISYPSASDSNQTPQANCNNNEKTINQDLCTPKATNQFPQMARMQRDLNSPSATLRVRAIKALRNPTNAAYNNFDVPHEEQDIITAEEREPPPPPSIEELMRDIVVYVEVRTGEDNRSEGVKKVISQLGARVNDKLLRGTTHVIFKDGLLSTYKKAKNWNIPVVSILWVEACKNKHIICDPNEYPISNIDRYENPELYEKMKRHKSMQPDSECNKRIRLRHGTPKDSTPKTVAETLIKTSSAINNTPKSSRKQSDISQYFRNLANANSTPITGSNALARSTTAITKAKDVAESPATQLLNRIESNSFTPLQPRQIRSDTNFTNFSISMPLKSTSKSGNTSENTITSSESRKCLKFPSPGQRSAKKKTLNLPSPKKRVIHRRSSVQMPVAQSKSDYTLQVAETATPGRMTRRRSSIHSTVNMSLSTLVPNTPDLVAHSNQATFSAIPEEDGENISKKIANQTASQQQRQRSPKSPKNGSVIKRRVIRRRTTYTNKTPEMSPEKKAKPTKRRTLYTPKPLEENSLDAFTEINGTPKVLDGNLLQFALTPTTFMESNDSPAEKEKKKGIEGGALIEEHSSSMIFSSTRLPSANRRRTLFDVSMDIIQQRLHNINNSARRSMAHELTGIEKSTNVAPPTTNANALSSLKKHVFEIDDECEELAAPKIPASTNPMSPTKTAVKKRKLFIPNDSSLILTATPPTSAKKSTTETSAKRRRTMTPKVAEKPVISKPRNGITPNINSRSDVIIKSSEPTQISSFTKSAVKFVPKAPNKLSENEKCETSKESSYTQLKITASITNSKVAESGPTLTANCVVVSAVQSASVSESRGATETAKPSNSATTTTTTTPLCNSRTTATTPPKLKGSFMSFISNKSSDTVVKQQLQQQEMEVDENIALNAPSNSAVLSETIAAAAAISVGNAKLPTPIEEIPLPLPPLPTPPTTTSNQPQPKVVTKSQMSAIPDKAKDAGCGASTQLTKSTPGGSRKWPYIVCTNMHREQIKVMREAIAALGGLQLNHCVNDDTTHVVSYEPRRTLNLLRGLIRGLWILDYKWVVDSLKAGSWLNEEEYEMRVFSRAVEICRTERQAFGITYKCELFTDLGTFYISSRCGPISKDSLKELIELCGGKVVDHRKRAKYILGDPHKALEDKVYVTPFWVLDSITHMQVMRQQKYSYVSNPIAKPPQPQLPQPNADAVGST